MVDKTELEKTIKWFRKNHPLNCFYCGLKLKHSRGLMVTRHDPDILTKDHVIPRAKGGTDDGLNKVPCCKICNRDKAIMSLEEFREFRTLQILYEFFGERAYRLRCIELEENLKRIRKINFPENEGLERKIE